MHGRFQKDLPSTLMCVAACETVLGAQGMSSAHAWETAHYGAVKRNPYSGPKTRGTMARNRSGEVVVSRQRVAIWEQECPAVAAVVRSPLWDFLRRPAAFDRAQWDQLEPYSRAASHVTTIFYDRRAEFDEALLVRLASCGTFDGIAALCSILVTFRGASDEADGYALTCARYIPPAVSLIAPVSVARRVALPLFAYLRLLVLDRVHSGGKTLLTSGCDIHELIDAAQELAPVKCRRWSTMFTQQKTDPRGVLLVTPPQRADWIKDHLTPLTSTKGRTARQLWDGRLSPMSHPRGPWASDAVPKYHPSALARMRVALGEYA